MATSIHTRRRARHASQGRAIVTLLVLFAFVLQSFIVQTHVHLLPASTTGRVSDAAIALQHGAGGDNDASQCPWCQAVLSSSAYLTPTVIPIHLPVAFGYVEPIFLRAVIAASTTSHAWQSRAPPA